MNWIKRMFDSQDNGVEAHLVLTVLAVIAMIGLAIWHVFGLHNPFNASDFGQGIGFTLTGSGAAAWGQGLQKGAGS